MCVIVIHQNEAAIYVCELCQKQGNAVRSMQLTETVETLLPDVEFQNVSSDTRFSPQMPRGDGKVCDPYLSEQSLLSLCQLVVS